MAAGAIILGIKPAPKRDEESCPGQARAELLLLTRWISQQENHDETTETD
jgi:hypothetical protein